MKIMPGWFAALSFLALLPLTNPAFAEFDPQYRNYAALLAAHVQWTEGGHASTVDYEALAADRASLKTVLDELSSLSESRFSAWPDADQKAFLINAYNAYTLALILSRYPDLESIRDLGSLFRSPWEKAFIPLLGGMRSLDWIEHARLRADYPDARIHFAVNCASVGCPALRPEPYLGERLEPQLDDARDRFLGDRTRNRFDAEDHELRISPIFKWYREDFEHAAGSLEAWLGQHAEVLGEDAASKQGLKAGEFTLEFGDYDWTLNDAS